MHAFDVLGDPVRRRILELLAEGAACAGGEMTAGDVVDVIRSEFGISQPAVSQHLKVLRDAGFAVVRPDGRRRLYAVQPDAFREVDEWVERFRRFWGPPLDALATELVRGRRTAAQTAADGDGDGDGDQRVHTTETVLDDRSTT